MTARMDNDGKLDAFFVKRLASNITLKLASSFLNSNVEHGMISADIDIESTAISKHRQAQYDWVQTRPGHLQL